MLPYGNKRFGLYIFLPRPESSLSKFQSALTPENWEAWMAQFALRSGSIEIPRFIFEYSHYLNDAHRPFFLSIRDDQTGNLLFLGSVVDPQG